MEVDSVAQCIGACVGPRSDLDALAKNKICSCARICPIIPFICPLNVLFVISTDLSQLQSWIYFERYDICVTIMFEILFFHYVFWDICIPCMRSETCRRLGGTCCLDFQSNFTVLQNFGKFLPYYSALQPIRQYSSSYRLLTQSV